MQQQILSPSSAINYGTKEFGPIILALAFVLALGGVTAAAIAVCGWGHIKSTSVSWAHKSVEIVCR